MREPQGVASLALGYVFHWAFSPPLLNPKLEKVSANRMQNKVKNMIFSLCSAEVQCDGAEK